MITKANSRSTVHRPAYLDYIGVKSFDALGNVNGERRFIGLFATSAYTGSVRNIPIVRDKVDAVLRNAGFPIDSHSGKDLLGILETYPRDELFQIEIPDLAATATGIQRLQERRRTKLFLRPDIYGRFMSAVVYLPRDRYTTSVRLRIEQELRETFHAESIDYEARITESALARVFFRIRLPRTAELAEVDVKELEQRLMRASRSWSEGIAEVLREHRSAEDADVLSALWAEAFPAGYRVDYEVEDALEDIERFEKYGAEAERAGRVTKQIKPGVHVYLPEGAGEALEEDARVKLYLMEPRALAKSFPTSTTSALKSWMSGPSRSKPRIIAISSFTTSDSSTPRASTPPWLRETCWAPPSVQPSRVLSNQTTLTGWFSVKAYIGVKWWYSVPTPSTCGKWATPIPSDSLQIPCWATPMLHVDSMSSSLHASTPPFRKDSGPNAKRQRGQRSLSRSSRWPRWMPIAFCVLS